METENNVSLAKLWNLNLEGRDLVEILEWCSRQFGSNAVFTTSLGAEDQVITHALATSKLRVKISTIDTGKLFSETEELIAKTEDRYGISIARVKPSEKCVRDLSQTYGQEPMFDSIAGRKACCYARKVLPLLEILFGKHAWITGLRKDQHQNRAGTQIIQYDDQHSLFKVNPLTDWSHDDIWSYVNINEIPVNPLHKQGFLSIGCAPCTRAVTPGENERAGRWWWESSERKECGLHL